MKNHFYNGLVILVVLLALASFAGAFVTVTVDPLPGAEPAPPAVAPDCLAQSAARDLPIIYKITYNGTSTIFEVKDDFKCGKLHKDVFIDPDKLGILRVQHIPIKDANDATAYSIEVWGLTDAEAADFSTWTPGNTDAAKNKDNKREYQFILDQGTLKELNNDKISVTVAGASYTVYGRSINLATIIDDSNTKWFPKKDAQRCKVKYGCWINNGAAGNCAASTPEGKCDTTAQVDGTWGQFKFKNFYDFIKTDSARKFYLVIENSNTPNNSSAWKDSVLIPLNIGKAPAPPVTPQPTGKCSTIVQCKALIDIVFGKSRAFR